MTPHSSISNKHILIGFGPSYTELALLELQMGISISMPEGTTGENEVIPTT
jgi:hypothetical protein